MALDPDTILDRGSLRRRLTAWRVLAILLVVALIVIAVASRMDGFAPARAGHIARFDVTGFISGDDKTLKRLADIAEADSVKALILRIDSPGGTTAGAEALYGAIREVAAEKPVVAVVDTMAASGGYIAALGADRIFARGNALVGSIGVLFQWPEAGRLLEWLGIEIYEVKSAPLKAEPNYFEPPSPQAQAMLRDLVRDTYDWFVGLVGERRGLDAAIARDLGDGRIFTGRQALDLDLIDAIGGEPEVKAWLAAEHGIDADMDVRDWEIEKEGWMPSLLGRMGAGLMQALGLGHLAPLMERARLLSLDGLLAVWHPPFAVRDGGETPAP